MLTPDERLNYRHRLLSLLHQALASVGGALVRTVTVRTSDKRHEATLVVAPVGHAAATAGAESFPGLFFSPGEAAIWHALAGKELYGKEIARALGREYDSDPELKLLLRNLVARKVLTHERGKGYARAHRAAEGKTG